MKDVEMCKKTMLKDTIGAIALFVTLYVSLSLLT